MLLLQLTEPVHPGQHLLRTSRFGFQQGQLTGGLRLDAVHQDQLKAMQAFRPLLRIGQRGDAGLVIVVGRADQLQEVGLSQVGAEGGGLPTLRGGALEGLRGDGLDGFGLFGRLLRVAAVQFLDAGAGLRDAGVQPGTLILVTGGGAQLCQLGELVLQQEALLHGGGRPSFAGGGFRRPAGFRPVRIGAPALRRGRGLFGRSAFLLHRPLIGVRHGHRHGGGYQFLPFQAGCGKILTGHRLFLCTLVAHTSDRSGRTCLPGRSGNCIGIGRPCGQGRGIAGTVPGHGERGGGRHACLQGPCGVQLPVEGGRGGARQMFLDRQVEALVDGQVVELAGGALKPSLQGLELVLLEFGSGDRDLPGGQAIDKVGLAPGDAGLPFQGQGTRLGIAQFVTQYGQGGPAFGDLAVQFLGAGALGVLALPFQPGDAARQFAFLAALGGHGGHGPGGLLLTFGGLAAETLLQGHAALGGTGTLLLFAQGAQQGQGLFLTAC